MSNLLEETLATIIGYRLNVDDIVYIGDRSFKYKCTWEEFEILADREYDAFYSKQEVAGDLVILFKDGRYLERQKYDGFVNWKVVKPLKPRLGEYKKIKSLFVSTKDKNREWWETLKEINSKVEENDL